MWDEIAPDQSAISVMHIGAFNNCTLTDQERAPEILQNPLLVGSDN
jgi:hypothetical protein